MMNAGQLPKVREASLGDYRQISSLESQYGLKVKSYEEWSHLWTGNPVYQELRADWPIGWVLENQEKQILGSIENIPLLYEFEGKKIIVSTGRNWVLDSRYRAYSTLLLDYYFSQKSVNLFLEGGVSFEAFHAFKEFELLPVPNGDLDRSAYWVAHYRGFVASALVKKSVPLARLLTYPLSVALFCKDRFRTSRGPLRWQEFDVRFCTHFSDRFDEFWNGLKAERSNILLSLRTSEMLEWHFKFALLRHKAWVLTISNGSRLVAYAIFDRNDNRQFGLKRMVLADFQTLDGNNSLLLPMLGWALKKCEAEGIHTLDIRGFCPEKRALIEQIVPYRRKLPWWLYVYKARDESLARSLTNPSVWDPSPFDGDSTF